MRRRGFFINSAVIVLIIPLLLLLATYEDVSSFIVHSQSVRVQSERTYNVVNSVTLDFQKALKISGKRALVAAVDYVVNTGNFLNTDADKAIKELVLQGQLPGVNYDFDRVMKDQSIKTWVSNISAILKSQGFRVQESPDEVINNIDMTVALLDAFTVVIKARITNITIVDMLGQVVYQGPIPSSGDYLYAFIDINGLEDPLHSAKSRGKYFRSIQACEYPYPKLIPPFSLANGTGQGSGVVVGRFGTELEYNLTHVWDLDNDYITNLTINGVKVTTDAVILKNDDRGVLVLGNGESEVSNWCSSLGYRINITIRNDVGINLDDYQIPLLISDSKGFTSDMLNFIFSHTQTSSDSDVFRKGASVEIYDSNCNPVPFWIEYWDPDNKKALIWIRDTIPKGAQETYSLYFGSGALTKGNGETVFEFFTGNITINGGDEVPYLLTASPLNLNGGFAVRFRMKADGDYSDWDSGIGVEDSSGRVLLFTDDTTKSGDGLAIHRPWWRYLSYTTARYPITTYHVYEALMKPYSSTEKDSKFKDITDMRVNDDYTRNWQDPLTNIYLVTDSEKKKRKTTYEWVLVRKYDISSDLLEDPNFNGINFYWRTTTLDEVIERKPSNPGSPGGMTSASVYDLQPLIDCLLGNRYFAIEDGWSFFERLEGGTHNHNRYVRLAHQMQDKLDYKPEKGYYPIGLVSFMIPHAVYDERLFNVMSSNGIPVEEGQSSADYYFLDYYFGSGPKVSGNRVWGISRGSSPLIGNLGEIPFFLDKTTACELLGWQGALQLAGYNCS
ncbi:DUF2341 domain-containing protein [Thermococcus stetteri]|uniref:DUF2341 domain-containing protein n=1 Tax=Thermococcus stetteri TaxID=49900 RepID=UPI001AE8F4BC|nr:DUF2341 domain-containing protein [Thermococcus stetteri]MBP1911755.1 hypothetical protein [Thermococcus stetteri]